jgi:hypothetical protein
VLTSEARAFKQCANVPAPPPSRGEGIKTCLPLKRRELNSALPETPLLVRRFKHMP